MTICIKLPIKRRIKACYGKCSMLTVMSRWRCRSAGEASLSWSAKQRETLSGPLLSEGHPLAVHRSDTARVVCCVFEKKERAASDALYRNFYLTLKSTKQQDLGYTFKS